MDSNAIWLKQVNRLGRSTLIAAMAMCFLPFLYVSIVYGAMPPLESAIAGFIGVAAAFGVVWIVEPLSYFPILGPAGTYMSFLAGSIGQMRVPAAQVAKNVAEVKDNTREAEIVAICGIAGSVYINIAILTLTAVAGTIMLAVLPAVVINAIETYVLASIFGAVLAMFSRGRLKIAIPVMVFAIFFNWVNRMGVFPVMVGRLGMLFCVIVGVIVARVLYKRGLAK